jgi:acyl transferase domain-containing protein
MLEAPEAPPLSHVAATAALAAPTLPNDSPGGGRRVDGRGHARGGRRGRRRSRRRPRAGERVVPEVAFRHGQGSQRPGMTQRLIETEPVFREAMELCDALLQPHQATHCSGIAGRRRGRNGSMTRPGPARAVRRGYALTAVGLVGCEPIAVMGHSVGEHVRRASPACSASRTGCRQARGRLR